MQQDKHLTEEGGRQLAPLEDEMNEDYTIQIALFFGGSVPLVALTQALGWGMPGFVVGAVIAAIVAATGGSWFYRIPGFQKYADLDWSVLLRPLPDDEEENVIDADPPQPKEEPRTTPEPVPTPAHEDMFTHHRGTVAIPGVRRITVDEIVSHTVFNGYKIYIGRSLTQEHHPALPISFYRRHIKLIGASQKGKSSMAAALLEIITHTHDERHVLVALLDKEDQTAQLFADLPHLAEFLVGEEPVLLHARTSEQVLEYLEYIITELNFRYTLSKDEIAREPLLIVYLEEFLSLKDDFKLRIDALSGQEKEQAKKDYARLVFCIKEIARRGLKAGIQLLMCAQVDYRDEDLQEALINVTSGLCFCVRATTAQAAGFYQTELLNRNAKDNKTGQAVAEMPDCKDLVLAPDYDLEQRLIALEKNQRANAPQPELRTQRVSPLAPAGTNKSQKESDLRSLFPESPEHSRTPHLSVVSSHAGVSTETPQHSTNEPGEPAEFNSGVFIPEETDSLLSELQAELLITNYRRCSNVNESLKQIRNEKGQGLSGRYFRHASWILEQRGLKRTRRA